MFEVEPVINSKRLRDFACRFRYFEDIIDLFAGDPSEPVLVDLKDKVSRQQPSIPVNISL